MHSTISSKRAVSCQWFVTDSVTPAVPVFATSFFIRLEIWELWYKSKPTSNLIKEIC